MNSQYPSKLGQHTNNQPPSEPIYPDQANAINPNSIQPVTSNQDYNQKLPKLHSLNILIWIKTYKPGWQFWLASPLSLVAFGVVVWAIITMFQPD